MEKMEINKPGLKFIKSEIDIEKNEAKNTQYYIAFKDNSPDSYLINSYKGSVILVNNGKKVDHKIPECKKII